jgi:hypothetical protein
VIVSVSKCAVQKLVTAGGLDDRAYLPGIGAFTKEDLRGDCRCIAGGHSRTRLSCDLQHRLVGDCRCLTEQQTDVFGRAHLVDMKLQQRHGGLRKWRLMNAGVAKVAGLQVNAVSMKLKERRISCRVHRWPGRRRLYNQMRKPPL